MSHSTTTDTTTTVGSFTFDSATGIITGPRAFMESTDYADWITEIKSGRNVVLNFSASGRYGSDVTFETSLLVSLQTRYAAWHGMHQMFGTLDR